MKEYLSSNYDVHIVTMRIALLVCLDRIKHLHPELSGEPRREHP